MPLIDADRVRAIFVDCLYEDSTVTTFRSEGISGGAIPADAVSVKGILAAYILNPAKLEEHRSEITAMLLALPEPFMKSKGGGWSFLNACQDRSGEQWTGFHQTMDQLFTLGLGIGRVKNLMPREVWSALPGGMPYYMVDDDA